MSFKLTVGMSPFETAPVRYPSWCLYIVNVNVNVISIHTARKKNLGIEGAPAVPHHFVRVGSRSTGCSNSHRVSS